MGDGIGADRRTCPSCGSEQSFIALQCRGCGAPLHVREGAARRRLRWAGIGAVVLLGAVGTYLVLTGLWEAHEEPETNVVWETALGVTPVDRWAEHLDPRDTWWVTPAGDLLLLNGPSALHAVDRATGRIVWRTAHEDRGELTVSGEGVDVVADGVAYIRAGSSVYAVAIESGEELWRHAEDGATVRTVAVSGGTIALHTTPVAHGVEPVVLPSAVGLDVTSGEEIWRVGVESDASIDRRLEGVAGDDDHVYVGLRHVDWEASASTGSLAAVHPGDGREVWRIESDGTGLRPHPAGDVLVVAGDTVIAGVDPHDAAELWRWELGRAGSNYHVDLVRDDLLVVSEVEREPDAAREVLTAGDPTNGDERWTVDVPPFRGALATDDRAIYVLGEPQRGDAAQLRAFDLADGDELWVSAPDLLEIEDRRGARTVTDGDAVYIVDDAGSLVSLDREDGSERWRMAPSVETAHDPPLVRDDVVFVTGSDGALRAIDIDDGTELWRARVGIVGFSQPAVDADRVYVTTGLGSTRAFDVRSGDELWRTDNRRDQLQMDTPRPVAIEDAIITAIGDELVALDGESGAERWSVPLSAIGTGIDAGEGMIGVTDAAGELRLVDPETGEVVWHDRPGAEVAPAIAEGAVVVVTVGGKIRVYDAASGRSRWSVALDAPTAEPPTIADGSVYVIDGSTARTLDLHTGQERWAFDAGEGLTGGVAVHDARAHIATATGAVIVLDAADGELDRRLEIGQPADSSPIVANGRILIRSGDHLAALE